MINKIIKIFKIVIAVELVVLAGVYLTKQYSPKLVNATQWLAHNSATPEAFVITVTEISLTKEDGTFVTVWSGTQEVDLTKVSSLSTVETFKGDIPVGKYKKFKLYCGTNYPKVKGSVVVNGITYYTKTNHTSYATAPAELEVIRPWGVGTGGFALEQEFSPAIQLGGTVSDVYALVDLSYYLLYYDGDKSTSGGYDPMGSENYKNAGGVPAMFLGELPFAFVIGNPGKKEIYEYSSTYWSFPTAKGRLTLIFDSSDNLVGATNRTILADNISENKLYGSLSNEYGTAGISPNAFRKNADGTYRVEMATIGPGSPTGAHSVVFSNFQRSSHSGNFTLTNYKSGTDLTVTETHNGTYTLTRIQ